MNSSKEGLGIHLTQETDLHGQALGQSGVMGAAAEGGARANPLGEAASHSNPLMYLAGIGAGWLGRKGLAKAWKYLSGPVAREIGELSVVKSARALWEEYKPSKLWQRTKKAVLAQEPLDGKAAELAFDQSRASKLAEESSSQSLHRCASTLAKDSREASVAIPSVRDVLVSATTKAGAEKAGVKIAEEGLVKEGAMETGKVVGKSLLKKVPILGVAAGAAFAWGRAKEGDWAGAAGELASGVASCFPGIGTGISVTIDVGLAGRDIYYADSPQAKKSSLLEVAPLALGPAGVPILVYQQAKALERSSVVGPVGSRRLRSLSRPSLDPSQLVSHQPSLAALPGRAPALD